MFSDLKGSVNGLKKKKDSSVKKKNNNYIWNEHEACERDAPKYKHMFSTACMGCKLT